MDSRLASNWAYVDGQLVTVASDRPVRFSPGTTTIRIVVPTTGMVLPEPPGVMSWYSEIRVPSRRGE